MSEKEHCCKEMKSGLDSGELGLEYIPKFREYGLSVLDGGSSKITISFCPFCGARLLSSLRDEWCDQMDAWNLEYDSDSIPVLYRSSAWWLSKKR